MKIIFVTGASRGLGLEFVKQFLQKDNVVIASSRDPSKSEDILQLKEEFGEKLQLCKLDVTEENERSEVFNFIRDKFGKLDILINNAGIRFGGKKYCDEFGKLTKEDFSAIYQVNTIAPLMISESFFSLLKNANKSKIINISSTSGSIAKRNSNKGGYSYSSSKAALNMITRALSFDLKEHDITVIALHPGWVKTTMEYTENAPLYPEESVKGMIEVIDRVTITDSGKFLDFKGNELPW